jgi:hypothetical protein
VPFILTVPSTVSSHGGCAADQTRWLPTCDLQEMQQNRACPCSCQCCSSWGRLNCCWTSCLSSWLVSC